MSQDEVDAPPENLMSFTELLNLALAFNARVDSLWQRMIYTHAAIVGVMVFFASSFEPFFLPRLLVYFFYSINIGITVSAFNESYSGLDAALHDLKRFPKSKQSGHIQSWVLEQSYHHHARRRVYMLGVVWLVIGYLLLYPVGVKLITG